MNQITNGLFGVVRLVLVGAAASAVVAFFALGSVARFFVGVSIGFVCAAGAVLFSRFLVLFFAAAGFFT